MKTPTWATVVGILMMLLGGCGSMKNFQLIMMPSLLENQKAMMKGFTGMSSIRNDTVVKTQGDSNIIIINKTQSPFSNKDIAQSMEKMYNVSDYQKMWVVRLGYIGFIPVLLYFLAGVFLLIRRKFSIKLAVIALVVSVLFSIARIAILSRDTQLNFIAMGSGFGALFGIMIDIILLIIIIASDRSAYRAENLEGSTVDRF